MPDATPDPNESVEIVHPTLPGQAGTCFRFQLPIWEARGWTVSADQTDESQRTTASGDVEVPAPPAAATGQTASPVTTTPVKEG